MQARYHKEGKQIIKQIIKTLQDIYPDMSSTPAMTMTEMYLASKSSSPSTTKSSWRSSFLKLKEMSFWGKSNDANKSVKAIQPGTIVEPKIKKTPRSLAEIKAKKYIKHLEELYKIAGNRADKTIDDCMLDKILADVQPGGELTTMPELRAAVGITLCYRYLGFTSKVINRTIEIEAELHPFWSNTELKISAALYLLKRHAPELKVVSEEKNEKSDRASYRYK